VKIQTGMNSEPPREDKSRRSQKRASEQMVDTYKCLGKQVNIKVTKLVFDSSLVYGKLKLAKDYLIN